MNLDFVRRTYNKSAHPHKKTTHLRFLFASQIFFIWLQNGRREWTSKLRSGWCLPQRIGSRSMAHGRERHWIEAVGYGIFKFMENAQMSPLFRSSNPGIDSMVGVMFVALFGLIMSLVAFCAELYYYHKKQMLLLRLKTRRALAEQAHLTAAAQVSGNEWMFNYNSLTASQEENNICIISIKEMTTLNRKNIKIFVNSTVQQQMEQRLQCPTMGELHACFGEVYIWFPLYTFYFMGYNDKMYCETFKIVLSVIAARQWVNIVSKWTSEIHGR